MPEPTPAHIPVLFTEVLGVLDPRAGETFADCTAGLGGHAVGAAELIGPTGRVILNDADAANLENASKAVEQVFGSSGDSDRVIPVHGDFAELPRWLAKHDLRADMLLADLGFASNQVDDPTRGLSFSRDGPLDMRLNTANPVTAAELVNTLSEQELADLIRRYGEDTHARRIARAIIAERENEPFETTRRLGEVIRQAAPRRQSGSIHPATKTFQALRIAVNDELGSLESLLRAIGRAGRAIGEGHDTWLNPGARVAIISFHSLEDRPVKRAFGGLVAQELAEQISARLVRPDDKEVRRNPRARSARLRAIRLSG